MTISSVALNILRASEPHFLCENKSSGSDGYPFGKVTYSNTPSTSPDSESHTDNASKLTNDESQLSQRVIANHIGDLLLSGRRAGDVRDTLTSLPIRKKSTESHSHDALQVPVNSTVFQRKRSEFTTGLLSLMNFFTKYIWQDMNTGSGVALSNYTKLQKVLNFPQLARDSRSEEDCMLSLVGIPESVRQKLPTTGLESALQREIIEISRLATELLYNSNSDAFSNRPLVTAHDMGVFLCKLNRDNQLVAEKLGLASDKDVGSILPTGDGLAFNVNAENLSLVSFQETLMTSMKLLEQSLQKSVDRSYTQSGIQAHCSTLFNSEATGPESDLTYLLLLGLIESEAYSVLAVSLTDTKCPSLFIPAAVLRGKASATQPFDIRQLHEHSELTFEIEKMVENYQSYKMKVLKGDKKIAGGLSQRMLTLPVFGTMSLKNELGKFETPITEEADPRITRIEDELVQAIILVARKTGFLIQLYSGQTQMFSKPLHHEDIKEHITALREEQNTKSRQLKEIIVDRHYGCLREQDIFRTRFDDLERRWGKYRCLVDFQSSLLRDIRTLQNELDDLITSKRESGARFDGMDSAAIQAGVPLQDDKTQKSNTAKFQCSEETSSLNRVKIAASKSILILQHKVYELESEMEFWAKASSY